MRRSTRGLSLLARALLTLLRREARGGVVPLKMEFGAVDSAREIARGIALAFGASAGERRQLPALCAELERAGFVAVVPAGISLLASRDSDTRSIVSPRDHETYTASTAASAREARKRRERDAKERVSPRNHKTREATDAAETSPRHSAAVDSHESDAKSGTSPRNHETHAADAAPAPVPDLRPAVLDAKIVPSARNESTSIDGTSPAISLRKEREVASSLGDSEQPWQRVPERVAETLARRSGGRIVLAVIGRDEPFRRLLAELDADRPRFAEELERWADLVAQGRDGWWRHGERGRERLLGRRGEDGLYPAHGLRRCLQEARGSLYRDESSVRAPSASPGAPGSAAAPVAKVAPPTATMAERARATSAALARQQREETEHARKGRMNS